MGRIHTIWFEGLNSARKRH